jgi:hypothetical protein
MRSFVGMAKLLLPVTSSTLLLVWCVMGLAVTVEERAAILADGTDFSAEEAALMMMPAWPLPGEGGESQDRTVDIAIPAVERGTISPSAAAAASPICATQPETRPISNRGYVRPPVMYGHLHMGKTGGTTLNLNVSTHYELACGHKGYSFDAARRNRKLALLASNPSNLFRPEFIKVPTHEIEEWGYAECDWISHEADWEIWTRPWQIWNRVGENFLVPLELHVPCRDPVGHLMSMCRHYEKEFDCNTQDVGKEIKNCLSGLLSRFSPRLLTWPGIHLKCFNWSASFDGQYMDYIGTKLLRKRQVTPFVQVHTNKPRNASSECVWKSALLQKRIMIYMLEEYAYYRFCAGCLGSTEDILAAR